MSDSLTAAVIPKFEKDDCTVQELNCDGEPSSNVPSGEIEVIFPYFVNGNLTFSGGSIVKVDLSNLKITEDDNAKNLILNTTSDLGTLSLNNSLESLSAFRTALNRELFKIREFNIISNGGGSNPPKLFLSYLEGDDSNLKDEVSSRSVTRICKFKYIPTSLFKTALNYVIPEETSDNNFGEVIGAAGKTFRELLNSTDILTEEAIIDLVLDFFSIYNIDEDEIVKQRGLPANGGYYTIFNGNAYIKMPDISGRDSGSFYSDIYSNESNFYIEISNGRKSFKRSKFEKVSLPISATVDDGNISLPDTGELTITLDTASSASDIKNAYLSILTVGETIESSKRSVRFFSDGLELFTIPILSANDLFPITENRKGSLTFDLSTKEEELGVYFTDFSSGESKIEETGIPYLGGVFEGEAFFGEKNRAEMALTDKSKTSSVRKNDRRYFSPKAAGTIPILNSIRPKLYNSVPDKWIGMNSARTGSSDDKIDISFSVSNFDNINFDSLGEEVRFALYIEDRSGQISRVAGENITISRGLPSITGISPNGYSGSEELLTTSEGVTFTFAGEGLSSSVGIKVVLKGSEIGLTSYFTNADLIYTPGNEISTLKVLSALSSIGMEAGQEYDIFLIGPSGESGSGTRAYINEAEGEEQIEETKILASFRDDEFSVRRFNNAPITEIPILTDSDAQLVLKSKQRLFSGKFDIYAYIGIDDLDIAKAISGDNVLTLNIDGSTLYIPLSLEYEFSTAFGNNFSRNFLNSSAILKLPGSSYEKHNLFPLLNVTSGAIVFYNKKIIEDADENKNLTASSGNYSKIDLGSSDKKPFVLGPTISGIIADVPGADNYISTFSVEETEAEIIEVFSDKGFSSGDISIFQKIPQLGIVFSGSSGSNLKRQYDFFIGEKKINKYMSGKIRELGGNSFLAEFKNVAITEEGRLDVYLEKNDKIFNYKSSSLLLNKRASFKLEPNDFSKLSDGTLNILSDITDWFTEGILTNQDNKLDLLIPDGSSGVLLDPLNTTSEIHKMLAPLTIKPNLTTNISGSDGVDTTTILKNFSNEASELVRLSLEIPSGEVLSSNQYHEDASGTAVGYLDWELTGGASIKCNVPEIVSIKTSVEAQNSIPIEEINGAVLKPGSEIKILVRNTKKNFKVIFNEVFVAKIKGIPKKVRRGEYEVTVLIPSGVVAFDCIDICASTTNSKRLNSKLRLGEQYVRNIDQNMSRKLFGNTKDKIPDVEQLKDFISDFPLRFVSVELDKSLVPTDLINSFCDFSWHLTADLKVALNGFQVLLIPIQVILCIIDVICALLDPRKLAIAIIRLFFCIYDLLLLIPQISVPVMYLQLILHFIKLLECVLLKVIEIITAVNEIIKAMEIAVTQELWGALQTLEEILSEYLFELNVDLQVLEPVITILAIFIQILSLVFNLPCPSDGGIGDQACGLQGTMLAGLVSEKIAPGGGEYDPSVLLPFAQYFTNDEIDERIASGSGSTYELWAEGDEIVDTQTEATFYEAMDIDLDSLRTINGTDFEASFSCSFTKSTKGLGNPTLVKFKFNDKLDNSGFSNKKVLDPLLNRDAPFHLMEDDSGTLKVATGKGNFVSPIDSEIFIDIDGDKGTVKPLTLTFEVPVTEPNPETGMLEEVGREEVIRTFDDIPKMAIMDENSDLYFIEPDGIEFDSDDNIESITARVINKSSAEKQRFSRDDQEIDTDGDGVADDEGKVFDLPQIFFVDMRSISDELQNACFASSFNEFLFDEDETGDTDDITEIIEESQECIEEYKAVIEAIISSIRGSLEGGVVPSPVDLEEITKAHQELIDCLNGKADDMCRFVVNPLNTSFLIEEDNDQTPREDFPEEVFDPETSSSFDVEQNGPAFTGAREYAGGIGDAAVLGIGEVATLRITPRDSYDIELSGDFSEKIFLNIISDSTGSAKILENDDGTTIEKSGKDYLIRLIAEAEGEVKLTASICNRTIQAITFAGIELEEETSEVDCVPDVTVDSDEVFRPGALAKVDRVLVINYIRKAVASISQPDDSDTAITSPQVFGTNLEN